MLENFQGSSTQILTHHSPSVLRLNILETTHINISAKHDGELILYNQIVPADTSLEFMFDASVNFDLLNAKHIQGNLNDTTFVSGSDDITLRVWDLTKNFAPEDIEDINILIR